LDFIRIVYSSKKKFSTKMVDKQYYTSYNIVEI